ncbi:M14 family metallopeptidase [Persephonella sp.]
MGKELLFEFPSPSRDSLKVYGYRFRGNGNGPSVAVVAGLRGDELIQLYVASQLVRFLEERSKNDPYFIKGEVLVVPAVNTYGFNIDRRYWPLDNTDISRMFPGYDKGETTQRIAAYLFEKLKGFDYGIKLTSGIKSVAYIPHVKVFEMENSDIQSAYSFGLRYIHRIEPKPYDTVSLTYNWHIWNTKAYSIYGGKTGEIDFEYARFMKNGIIRFLSKKGVINYRIHELYCPTEITDSSLYNIKTTEAGIFHPFRSVGDVVVKGDILFTIEDPISGEEKLRVSSPVDGVIFQAHGFPMIYQGTSAFRIVTV